MNVFPIELNRACSSVLMLLTTACLWVGAIAPTSATESATEHGVLNVQAALERVDEVGTPTDQVTLLLLAARYAYTTGHWNDAQNYLDQALQRVLDLEDTQTQVNLLLLISEVRAEQSDPDGAIALLQRADVIAATITDPIAQSRAFQAIATHYGTLLQPAQAAVVLNQALTVLEDDPPSQDYQVALAAIALQFANLGQTELAQTLIAQSQAMSVVVEAEPETPLEPAPWQGNVGLLSNVFAGERTTGIVTLSGGANRRWPRNTFDASAQFTYNFDPDRDDADQFSGQLLTDSIHYFSNDLQYFVDTSVTSDNLENLNLRARLGTGLGVNLWEAGGDRRLDLRVGVGARYESFVDEDTNFTPVNATVGINYQDQWFSLLTFKQSLTVDVPVDDAADYLFQSQTELGIPISDRWSFSNTARLTLAGEPPDTNPALLFNLQTGLRYQF